MRTHSTPTPSPFSPHRSLQMLRFPSLPRLLPAPASLAVAFAAVAVGMSPMVLSGCGNNKKDKAREAMTDQAVDFRSELKQIPPMLDEVNTKMFKAAQGQNPSRADDVRSFDAAVERLRAKAKIVASEANKAEVDVQKYYTAWAKDIKNSGTADRADMRTGMQVSREKANTAQRYLDTARNQFKDLMGALDRVDAKLKADQSEGAIMAVQKDLGTVQVQTMNVKNYIDRLSESIDAAVR